MSYIGSSKCTFAADRLATYESQMHALARMRTATITVGNAGKFDNWVMKDDLTVIDKKIVDIAYIIQVLRPCLKI
jgi:hypothetical protein